MGNKPGLQLQVPGRGTLSLRHLVTDFTGTLSLDGRLLQGVRERLGALAGFLDITVATADTFGTVSEALAGLPLQLRFVGSGLDKANLIEQFGRSWVVALGNGRNDVAMLKKAELGIAVIGPEGAAGELLTVADIVVREVNDALELLSHPLRLNATLRL
jgi:soluble P-type ATPase